MGLNIGFIGAGNMSRYQATHAFSKIKNWNIYAVADTSAKALKQFKADNPDVVVYKDHKDLLKDPKVDAVLVIVPTGLHKAFAIDSLKAGKPVLLEKPMCLSVADCRQVMKVEEKTKTPLMVAHCRRFDPHWGKMAQLVSSGKLGGPVLWRAIHAGIGPGRWFMDEKMGGGPLIDGAVHNYDFANMMWGKAESVVANSIKLDKSCTAIDTGSAIIQYESGDQLLVCWSWVARGLGLFDIVGPKGFLQHGTGNTKVSKKDLDKNSFYCITNSKGKETLYKAEKDFSKMYVKQAKHFYDVINGKAECITSSEESIKAIAVAEAVLKAAKSGSSRKITF